MPFIRIPDNDEPIEVGFDAIDFGEETPPGLVTTDHLSSKVQRRVTAAKRNARKELSSDDTFWKELAESRGIELRDDDLMPKGSSKDSKEQEARWQKQHLAHVQTSSMRLPRR